MDASQEEMVDHLHQFWATIVFAVLGIHGTYLLVGLLFHVELFSFSEGFDWKCSKNKLEHHDSYAEDICFLAVFGVSDLLGRCVGDGPTPVVPIFPDKVSLVLAVTLAEIDQSCQNNIIIGFVADHLQEYVLGFYVIVMDAVVSEESDAESNSIEQDHFGLEWYYFSVGYDVGVDRFLLAVLQENLILFLRVVEVPGHEEGFALTHVL